MRDGAMSSSTPSFSPSLPWRTTSATIMGVTGALSRGFLHGLNRMEVTGLDRFLELLDSRKNVEARERGLITVSNHVSVLDDPLIWGVLPLKYGFHPSNHRWSLGSYDICFKSKLLAKFFNFGQVLPTHRNDYSDHGGLFQPTMTQAIRLLSAQPFGPSHISSKSDAETPLLHTSDPFSGNALTYSTNGLDSFPAPSAYPSRKHSWVHIFPEGRIHQHPTNSMRYFKWGISRLILESEPLPDIVPIFIDGNQHVMHESREWPRFLPRIGKKIKITFGEKIDGEKIFGDLRMKWRRLVNLQKDAMLLHGQEWELGTGELTEGLKYHEQAEALRKEVTYRMRLEVLKVRKSMGFPDEDPKAGLAETWMVEGNNKSGKKRDGSWVGDT